MASRMQNLTKTLFTPYVVCIMKEQTPYNECLLLVLPGMQQHFVLPAFILLQLQRHSATSFANQHTDFLFLKDGFDYC